MFGKAKFPVGQKQGVTVPLSAIIERGQLTGVFVVDKANTARLRLVRTGKHYGDRIEILSGLNQGERVVVENVERVRDGNRISN
jgi:multidrug efflux pump subunit AcrA (membrane-fusion protein)